MQTAHEWLRYATSVLYLCLGLLAVRGYLSDRRTGRAWLAVMFGVLGGISGAALVLPERGGGSGVDFARRILVALLVFVPYALFRFTGTFAAQRKATRVAAIGVTACLAGSIFAFGEIPESGRPITGWFRVYVLVLIAQWVLLSAIAVTGLWRQRRRQTLVARRRMELMAGGAAMFALALIIAGSRTGSPEVSATQIALQSLALSAGPLFLLGFAPPAWIVDILRRPDLERQRHSHVGLAGAVDRGAILDLMLPHALEAVGGSAVALVGASGEPERSIGDPGEIETLVRAAAEDATAVRVPMKAGTLLVRVGPAAPFFGDQERQMIESLAAIADIALERAVLVEQDRAARERIEKANIVLRDFVAAASHDLRTPVTVIRGFSEMLSEQWERLGEDEKRTYFDSIRRQTDHLNRMVEDLLTVSRIDAQAVAPRAEIVSIAAIIREVVGAQPDGRSEAVRIAADGPLHAVADAEHVRRMISNYLDNAFNYGEPPVTIRAASSGGWIEVRVCDEGPGVPVEFREHLFERFARADKRKSKSSQGTGLGLTIVRGLAQAAGGDAWFEPTAAGATFAIRLPEPAETEQKAG